MTQICLLESNNYLQEVRSQISDKVKGLHNIHNKNPDSQSITEHLVSYLHSSAAALIQENGRITSEQDEEYERILLNDLCKQAEV